MPHASSATTEHSRSANRAQEFRRGVRATFPLVVGAIPFGIIFGAVAVNGGLSPQATMAMSLFVFAGSAQFVAAGLAAAGAGVAIIVLTTFVVNLRHALYAASLAPHMKHLPQRWLALLGFWLTDESYLVVIDRYAQADDSRDKHWFFLGSALFMYTNWQLCTYIGIRAGQAIADPASWGLDFALPVTFIGMLVPMLRSRPVVACVLVAGVSAVLFHSLPNQLGLIIATLLGVATGALLQKRKAKA
ncbi:MAG: AzlC family ABC transporter permease [Caldilineaceae bacterium]|nr:AzlC family ABC transporter permease [Caldilineaceae bacterium]MCB9137434.1 AzlC family ABC transporter permease [Caldilineaceae bacterium]